MRILTALVLLLVFSRQSFGQDIIVKMNDDTIYCTIIKVQVEQIHFRYQENDTLRQKALPLSQVKSYYKDNTPQSSKKQKNNEGNPNIHKSNTSENLPNTIVTRQKERSTDQGLLIFSISGGYSHLLGRINKNLSPEFYNYTKELLSGAHFKSIISYYVSDNIGFGLKYSYFETKNKMSIIAQDPGTGIYNKGERSDRIMINSFNAGLAVKEPIIQEKLFYNGVFAVGYFSFRNNSTFFRDIIIKGESFGLDFDQALDYYFTPDIGLTFSVSCFLGVLGQLEYDYGGVKQFQKLPKDQLANVSRIDLSVGMKFNR